MSVLSVLRIVVIVALIILVIGLRVRGVRVRERRLLLLPAVLTVIGAIDLAKYAGQVRVVDGLLLGVSAVLAVGLGAARGATIKVFAKDGVPFLRYTVWTVLIWLVLVALRFGVIMLAHSVRAGAVAGTTSLLLMLGLSLLTEGLVVTPRARALGPPLAAAPRGHRPAH